MSPLQTMAGKKRQTKRNNRFVGIDVAANSVLDPVFRKRGFANRDLFARWPEIAPAPFGETTLPERLYWPPRANGAEGAILYLRCAPGTALAVSYEGERIAKAVNLYFGYYLVRDIKLSAEPFVPSKDTPEPAQDIAPEIRSAVAETVRSVKDDNLRAALQHLGENLKSRRRQGTFGKNQNISGDE